MGMLAAPKARLIQSFKAWCLTTRLEAVIIIIIIIIIIIKYALISVTLNI